MSSTSTAFWSRRQLLLWEAKCISAEVAGAGVAIGLGLGLDNWEAGGLMFLFCLLPVSLAMRLWHYSHVSVQPA